MVLRSTTWIRLLDWIEAATLRFGLLGPLTAGVIEAGGHSREGRQRLAQLAALQADSMRMAAGEQLEQFQEPVTSARPADLGGVWANA